mgnify:CR=1 FL=1
MRKLETNSWWPTLLVNKDKYSLRELGEMFGVSAGAINTALKRNGITRLPTRSGPREVKPGWPPGKSGGATTGRGSRSVSERRLHPWLEDLGVKADSEISKLCGLSSATVARIRRSRGIPASSARGGDVSSEKDNSLSVGVGGGERNSAWKVTLDNDEVFVVCAKNIAGASSISMTHAKGVVCIEWVGVVIE